MIHRYRAYEPHYNLMSVVTMIIYLSDTEIEIDCLHNNNEPKLAYHFEIMLCTERKDINGKLAYENDIIKCQIAGIDFEGLILYEHEQFIIKHEDRFWFLSQVTKFEIIGNIYGL